MAMMEVWKWHNNTTRGHVMTGFQGWVALCDGEARGAANPTERWEQAARAAVQAGRKRVEQVQRRQLGRGGIHGTNVLCVLAGQWERSNMRRWVYRLSAPLPRITARGIDCNLRDETPNVSRSLRGGNLHLYLVM